MDHRTLCDTLAEKLKMPREDIGILLNALSEAVETAALAQDVISIPGFGTFETRKRLERVAVHPATGKRMLYPPKMTLGFRPSSLLRKQLRDLD